MTAGPSVKGLARRMGVSGKEVKKRELVALRISTNLVKRHLITKKLSNRFRGGVKSRSNIRGSDTGIARRSGALIRSINRFTKVIKERLIGIVGTNAVQMRALENGAVITPKRSKFLTIPLPESLTSAGVARWTAAELRASPERGGFSGTWISKSDAGNLVILGAEAGSGKVRALFILKKKVVIPPKRPMAATVRETISEVEQMFARQLGAGLDKTIGR